MKLVLLVAAALSFATSTLGLNCYVTNGTFPTPVLTLSTYPNVACGSYKFTCAPANSYFCTQQDIDSAIVKYAFTFLNAASCSQMYAKPSSQASETCCCPEDGCNSPALNLGGCANTFADVLVHVSGGSSTQESATTAVAATPASTPLSFKASSGVADLLRSISLAFVILLGLTVLL